MTVGPETFGRDKLRHSLLRVTSAAIFGGGLYLGCTGEWSSAAAGVVVSAVTLGMDHLTSKLEAMFGGTGGYMVCSNQGAAPTIYLMELTAKDHRPFTGPCEGDLMPAVNP